MIINHKYKFIFIHIQKTAGSSVTDALFNIPNTKSIYFMHSMINVLDLNKHKDYFKFCFVRNPFDRLLSWYNMFVHKGIHNDWSNYILENSNSFSEFLKLQEVIFEKNELDSFKEYIGPTLYEKYPEIELFKIYEKLYNRIAKSKKKDKVLNKIKKVIQQDSYNGNHPNKNNIDYPKSISINQLDYISDNSGIVQCDFVGRFEQLEEDFRKITKQIGVDINIKHLNKFEHKPYREYYNQEDIKIVEKLCKRDLEYFGYHF